MSNRKKRFSKIVSIFIMSCVLIATITASTHTSNHISASSGKVLYENEYKVIKLFSKSELEKMTDITLTNKNAENMRAALTDADIWLEAGFKQEHAKYIASRFQKSKQQAQGILKKITKNPKLGLKVIVIDNEFYINVNIGSEYYKQGENVTESKEVVKESVQEDMKGSTKATENVLSAIKQLEIQIEYSKKDVELEYNYKSLKKCEYKNEFTGEKLKKDNAVKLTEKVLSGVDLQSASKKEIVNQVIKCLGVGSNYEEFSIEVKFFDGSELEFEIEQ